MKFSDKARYWWYLKGGDDLVKVAVALAVIAVLAFMLFATSGCAAKVAADPGVPDEQSPKLTEDPPKPTDADIEVVAINEDKVYAIYISDDHWTDSYHHYKTTSLLIKRLAKFGERYEIKQIEAMTSRWVEANPTRGFIVFVEKKKE